MNKRARVTLSYFLVFALVAIFLITYLALASKDVGPLNFYVDEDVTNLYNLTINNTDAGQDSNITQVNITLWGDLTFLTGSNGTNVSDVTFTNTSTVLSWENLTYFLINGSEMSYFWFNATASNPGTFNISVTLVNATDVIFLSNITVEVNDTTTPSSITFASPTPDDNSNLSQTTIAVNISAVDNYQIDTILIRLHNSFNDVINSTNTSVNAASGSSYLNFTGLDDDIYYINATVNDTSGNSNESVTYTITLDNTYPTISYGTQTSADYANISQTSIYVNVSFTETNLKTIVFTLLNDTDVVNSTSYTTATYNINWTSLPETNYSYEVNITDLADNTNTTGLRYVLLDTTYPTISYGGGESADYANLTQTSIYVNVTVTEANELNITFRLHNSTGEYNVTHFTDATRAINWTSLPEDTYTYNVTIRDIAGNNNVTSTYTITLDNTYPTISYGTQTSNDNVNLSQNSTYVNVTVTESNERNITFRLHNSTGEYNVTHFTDATRAINWTNLPDGTYTYNVTIRDEVGYTNTTTTRTILLDTTVPTISYGTQTSADYANISQTSIYVNVSFTETNLKTIVFTLLNDTDVVNSTSYTTATYNINWTSLPETNYSYEVNITDLADNTNTTGLRYVLLDNTIPVISFGTQTSANYANISQTSIYVNVSVTDDNFVNITFTLYNDTAIVNSTTFASTIYFINWTNLPEINYSYEVNITDLTNHQNTSGLRYVLLDATAPAINLIFPDNGTASTQNFYNFTFNISEANEIRNCSLIISGEVAGTISGVTNESTMGIFATIGVGTRTWNINCTDLANNIGNTSSRTLTVNAVPSTTSGGGSGGGLVSTVSEAQLANGVEKLLYRNWKTNFQVEGKTHSLSVKKIEENTVTIIVSSTPQEATLSLGETKMFDVTEDNIYDIQVTFNEIKNNKASLTIKSIPKKVVRETKPAVKPTVEEEPASEEIPEPEVRKVEERLAETKGIPWILIGIVIVVLMIIALIAILMVKKKKLIF